MFYVYLLYSPKLNRHYIGYTDDVEKRLLLHNSGKGAKSTRMSDDWQLIKFEEYDTKSEAMSREALIKTHKSLRYEFYGT